MNINIMVRLLPATMAAIVGMVLLLLTVLIPNITDNYKLILIVDGFIILTLSAIMYDIARIRNKLEV